MKIYLVIFSLFLFTLSCSMIQDKSNSPNFGRSLDSISAKQVEYSYRDELIPFYQQLKIKHYLEPMDSFSVVLVYPKMNVQDVVYIKIGESKGSISHFTVRYKLDKDGFFEYDKISNSEKTLQYSGEIRNLVMDIDSLTQNGVCPDFSKGTNMCTVFFDFTVGNQHYYFDYSEFNSSKKSIYNEKLIQLLRLIDKELKINSVLKCN